MKLLQYLHRGKSPYVAYTALFSFLCLVICRWLDATLPTPAALTDWLIPLEFIIFILPLGVYLLLNREKSSRSQLCLTLPRLSHVPLILTASVALIFGGLLMTVVLCGSGLTARSFALYDTFITHSGNGIYTVIAHALLPAICEEMLFRSLLCGEYSRRGAPIAVIVSSLLFGMLHFNIQMLALYIGAGIVLALVMYATRSVVASMAVHFIYNLFCIFAQPYIISFYINTSAPALFILICVTLFLVCAALFCLCASRLYGQLDKQGTTPPYPTENGWNQLLTALDENAVSLPFILCALIFIASVILF